MTLFSGRHKETPMTRKESSVWLGRAMSTGDVCLQTILKLVTIISFQQHALEALHNTLKESGADTSKFESLIEMDSGASEQIFKKLAEIQTQLDPIVQAVEQACKQLEDEI